MKILNKTSLFVIFSILIFFQMGYNTYAQRPPLQDDNKPQLIVPRYHLEPVTPLQRTGSEAIDTLPTINEYVKVILFADNTWQYLKMPNMPKETNIFEEAWSSERVNPYGIEYEDLEDAWSIWLVDSLNLYHIPYKGDVTIRSKFGIRRGRRHQGVDIPLKIGDPLYSPFPGKVRIASYNRKGYGNYVVLRHDNGLETVFAHLSEIKVKEGDWLNAGDVIGLGGSTGRSTGPHLHFETRYKGFAFDPQWLFDFNTGQLRHRLFVLKKKYFSPYSNYGQDFEDEILNEEDDKKEAAEREAMRWYTIKSGDNLGRIAQRYGTTVGAICRLNQGLTPKTTLRIGRKIRVR